VTELMGLGTQYPALRLLSLLTLGAMLAEWLYVRVVLHDVRSHDLKETAASIATTLGNQLMRPVSSLLLALPLYLGHQLRLFDIPSSNVLALVGLFVLVDLVFYWFHRSEHRVRVLWASHAVHHSATSLNLTAAVRLGWTGTLSGEVLFFLLLPLTVLGFHPVAVMAMLALNLLYQFFLHTAYAPRLGALEWVLNTPTHHRVHHAVNSSCLDKNFAGVFIVWDRMFGTFASASPDEKLRFGLLTPPPSQNVLTVNFFEWRRLLRDLRQAQGLKRRLRILFGAP
jgi:sterol desaturase/sphingolipid hydroxylase (fatty acid hydroxylase superfamily)